MVSDETEQVEVAIGIKQGIECSYLRISGVHFVGEADSAVITPDQPENEDSSGLTIERRIGVISRGRRSSAA